jgi:hypothetical protein
VYNANKNVASNESFLLHQVLQVKVRKHYNKEQEAVGMMFLQKLKVKAEGVALFKLVNLMSKHKRDKKNKKANDYTSYDDHRKFKKNKHNDNRKKKCFEQNMFVDWN